MLCVCDGFVSVTASVFLSQIMDNDEKNKKLLLSQIMDNDEKNKKDVAHKDNIMHSASKLQLTFQETIINDRRLCDYMLG